MIIVQAFIGRQKIGQSFKIKPVADDVDALRKAVKKEIPNSLKAYDASDLLVYRPGTEVPVPRGVKALGSGVTVPSSTTREEPLIVVAPFPHKQVS